LQTVTGDDSKARQDQNEAGLVLIRLYQLHGKPIKGTFDAEHLKAVHAYIFQNLPHHRPGVTRSDTPDWIKQRVLEGGRVPYNVHYASQAIETKITKILNEFGGPDAIRSLSPPDAAKNIARLYGDLDHAHAFYEGNSRTLREFTRELAKEAGFALDWRKTGVGTRERNELYVARDLAVLERAFPGLTEERAMKTNDRAEYEAYNTVRILRKVVADKTLDAIIRDRTRTDERGLHPQNVPSSHQEYRGQQVVRRQQREESDRRQTPAVEPVGRAAREANEAGHPLTADERTAKDSRKRRYTPGEDRPPDGRSQTKGGDRGGRGGRSR
jgi:fido (protein-threonine AMPylation protein)